jgi:transposase
MYQLHTEKQLRYFDEVIRLHYECGYGEDRIAKLLPLGHTTVSRWIAIFARENPQEATMKRPKVAKTAPTPSPEVPLEELPTDVQELQAELKKLRAQLTKAEIKAEVYDELINVAEAKFGIQIRKKAGAKQ